MHSRINKEKRKTDFRLPKLEVASATAGLVVVAGIWMESRSEIIISIKHWWRRPSDEAFGAVLVGLGVFVEVVTAIFIARQARRVESESNERVARAEQATAEANLERARLEQQLTRREIPREQFHTIADRLSMFRGQRIILTFFPSSMRRQHSLVKSAFSYGWRGGTSLFRTTQMLFLQMA
jgi:hypothetical protein